MLGVNTMIGTLRAIVYLLIVNEYGLLMIFSLLSSCIKRPSTPTLCLISEHLYQGHSTPMLCLLDLNDIQCMMNTILVNQFNMNCPCSGMALAYIFHFL